MLFLAAPPAVQQIPPSAIGSSGPDWGFWEVLVGITSISLASLAFILAGASVVLYFRGRDWIEEQVKKTVGREIERKEREMLCRLLGYVGFIFGMLHRVGLQPEFITQAVDFSKRAYEVLPDQTPEKMAAMNNLAFAYAVRGYDTDAESAIRYARALLVDYASSNEVDWLTTYAAVVGRFYNKFENPRKALLEAENMMEELQARGDVTPNHKQNAARHLETIRAALGKFGS
jgi:hypothetical protein